MTNEKLVDEDFLFDFDNGTIFRYNGTTQEVVIPAAIGGKPVTAIGGGVCNRLASVTIPKGVTSIEDCAFSDNRLTSVTIGANAPIHEAAFENGFAEFYDGNGKKAGVYTYAEHWEYHVPIETQHHSQKE